MTTVLAGWLADAVTSPWISLVISNALSASLLFLMILLAQRWIPWPSVRHALWLVVIVRLLLPPLVSIDVSLPATAEVRDSASALGRTDGGAGAMESAVLPAARTSVPLATTTARVPLASLPIPWALALLEFGGAALFLAIATHRIRRFHRELAGAGSAPEPVRQRLHDIAEKIGNSRVPRLLIADDPVPPMLVALPKATIVLPTGLIDRLSPAELDALFAHELAHAHRRDNWIRPLELLATAFYWWFPLVYVARRHLRSAEEAACDALVLRALPDSRRAYADCLVKTVEFLSLTGRPPALATGAVDSQDLKERIMNLFKPSALRAPSRRMQGVTATVALGVALLIPGWSQTDAAVEHPADSEPVPAEAPVAPEPPVVDLMFPEAPEPLEMDPRFPDASKVMIAREIKFRRAELELERQLMAIRAQGHELQRVLHELQVQQEVDQMAEELKFIAEQGGDEPKLQAEYELLRAERELDARVGQAKGKLDRRLQELELHLNEVSLAQQEALLQVDRISAKDNRLAAKEFLAKARALEEQMRETELERMALELEDETARNIAAQKYYEQLRQQNEATQVD